MWKLKKVNSQHHSNVRWAKVLNRKHAFTCLPLEFSISIRFFYLYKNIFQFSQPRGLSFIEPQSKERRRRKKRDLLLSHLYTFHWRWLKLNSKLNCIPLIECIMEILLHPHFFIIFRMRIIWIHDNVLNIFLLSWTPFPLTLIHI